MSMRIGVRVSLAVALLASAWGCTVDYYAAPAPPDRTPLTEREWAVLNGLTEQIDQTRRQLADTRAELATMRDRLNAAEGAVEEIRHGAGVGSGNIKELQQRLAALETEVRSQRELLKVREGELRLLRNAVLRTGGTAATVDTGAPAEKDSATAAPEPASVREAAEARRNYEDAWRRLRERDYRGAIEQFRKFVEQYPDSALTDNAQYWIGESYYALQEFDEAILEFDLVRKEYPKGDKVPAALLRIGYAFAELGNRVDARLILQEVIKRYPQSREAEKAQEKIRSLGT